MCEIIDFPTSRIRRLVCLLAPLTSTGENRLMLECYKSMIKAGLSVREAASQALAVIGEAW